MKNKNILVICERTPKYDGGSGDQKILYTSYYQMTNISYCIINDKVKERNSIENDTYYIDPFTKPNVSKNNWRFGGLVKSFSTKQDSFILSENYILGIADKIQKIINERNIQVLIFEQTGILMWSWFSYFANNLKCILRIHDSHYHYLLSDKKTRSELFSRIAILGSAYFHKKYEGKHIANWHQVHFLSHKEYEYYCKKYPLLTDKLIFTSSSVVKRQNLYSITNNKPTDILFVGTMSWKPNSDAVKWFLNDILPLIELKLPEVKVKIVGKSALDKIKSTKRNVEIVGFVESIEDEYKSTKLFINPSISGGGIKVKLMEASSYGLPSVTTSDGVSGFVKSVRDCFIVKDEPKEFADALVRLLEDKNLRKDYSQKVYNCSDEYFDINTNQRLWKAKLNKL